MASGSLSTIPLWQSERRMALLSTCPKRRMTRWPTIAGGLAATSAYAAYKLYRVYRYNFLPRYSTVNAMTPYPVSGQEVMGQRLGRYYGDLSQCIHRERFDKDGIILLEAPGPPPETVRNPCMVAEYAIIQYEDFLVTSRTESQELFKRHLDWLEEHASPVAEGRRVLHYHYDTPEERAPWGSGIAQGVAISALLRGYEHFQNDNYLETARQLFNAMDTPVGAGGHRFADAQFKLWYEEDNRCGHILNGHLFALFGVLDLYRVTGHPYYKQRFDLGLEAVKDNLSCFDIGFTTKYRVGAQDPANNSYHYIHAAQFQILYAITGDNFFRDGAQRFYDYHDRWQYRVLAFMYVLRGAVRQRMKWPIVTGSRRASRSRTAAILDSLPWRGQGAAAVEPSAT